MSKEEILKNNYSYMSNAAPSSHQQIYKAMDEFAQQQSIAFNEWIEDNDYWSQPPNQVITQNDIKVPFRIWYKQGQSVGGIKTEALYKLFEQHQQSLT